MNAQRVARRGAAARAAGLRGDIALLRRAPAADAKPIQRRIGRAVRSIEEALALGLDFRFAPDPELAVRRGHARNLAHALRREVDVGRLPEASRLAAELIETIGWIQRRVLEVEAAAPAGAWTASWSGRVLRLAARLLPAHLRRDFVEDQCGNLCAAASRRESACYLLGLLVRMPVVAAAALAHEEP